MAEVQTIAGASREGLGKGKARAERRNGQIPAVIYGNQENPIVITVEQSIIEQQLLKPDFFIRLLDINVGGKVYRVLPRDAQYHPVTDKPLHIDFLHYSRDRKLTVEIPVLFFNESESPGLKTGGVLNIVRHTIEISCVADAIPESFELDLTGLEVGDALHASALTLPENVALTITDRDFTVATISAPTVMPVDEEVEDEEGLEGEGEEGEEGEDTGEAKDETESDEGEKNKSENQEKKT
ncbi:MAG: 50S ribosomal protein L25/general stress protein Ctc [Pseudomonadota bacterium]|nr:50S ribosomal protein L25/general stress protein Ctc [Pseudomonadota bacterium]